MSVQEIGKQLVAHCRAGTEAEALATLYAPDVVSVEAADAGNGREVQGIDAIRGKHEWWAENFEVHGGSVSDPMPHGDDRFAVIFGIDATHKASGTRETMDEVGVYHVKDGKIVREEFFYPVG
ncbi:nuclear transport factor 2 family protein [Roseobacter sp. HKCCA0434]|uniref:nuclear transport factor 2 family protein n=1 Tax=Roseobacter sp. HKCCA0434 TaxID=3079297 RepID=UPI002905ACFD|nr:nuclear transport factor 2 family protein [Roseobacter sp. HKCCA0434]